MPTYTIKRIYEDGRSPRVIKRGVTLEKARAHCSDPETSSITAKAPRGCGGNSEIIAAWHGENMHWFDSYEEEK